MSGSPKYILTERIAQGGMAEIHLGKSVGLDGFARVCAFKRILPQYAQDSEFIQMFRNEASVVKQLQNKNIVQVYDFVSDGTSYMLVMEFVDGQDLRSLLAAVEQQRKKIPLEIACFVVLEILSGLSYAHNAMDVSGKSMGIIHRDVSPQNVLISYEGDTKITDFGIAKVQNSASTTRAGVLKGKFRYMSPEQAMGQTIDARSDIFAVGVIIWEMLTMQRLFKGEDMVVLEAVRLCKVKPPSSASKTPIPAELEAIVMRMLSRDVNKRYQTAKEAIRELSKFLYVYKPDFFPGEIAEFMNVIFREKIIAARERLRSTLALPVGAMGVGGAISEMSDGAARASELSPSGVLDVSRPAQKIGRLGANASGAMVPAMKRAAAGEKRDVEQRAVGQNLSSDKALAQAERGSVQSTQKNQQKPQRPHQTMGEQNRTQHRNLEPLPQQQAGRESGGKRGGSGRRTFAFRAPSSGGAPGSSFDVLLVVVLIFASAFFGAAFFLIKKKGSLRETHLRLTVSPADSSPLTVSLNGKPVKNIKDKSSAIIITLSSKREDIIEVSREGFKNASVTLQKPLLGGTVIQNILLERDSVPRISIKIITVPQNAVVVFQGEGKKNKQKTPALFENLPAGSRYQVTITHPKCKESIQDTVEVSQGPQRANQITKTYRLKNCKK